MALHRLTRIDLGVPDPAAVHRYYTDFGLTPTAGCGLATAGGGEQLRLLPAARRRLLRLGVGAEHPDDLDRVTAALHRLEIPAHRTATSVAAVDPGTEATVVVEIAPVIVQ